MKLDRRSRLIAAKHAASELGIPYTTLRDVVFRGELAVVKIGTAWYFDRNDVDQYVQTAKIVYGTKETASGR
jgi:excisionase family DNA binding protein